ncbi:hypothetical protein EYF80_019583 [Liparis tanakae]|uniref:Uncharacterized protein n=1 Tax=Liparis tanakae TaxID=230148 RepID=A0A4Z2HZ31_9TELE|nr:hypothetical protein EYF80_019583 [Liparis tanakae]
MDTLNTVKSAQTYRTNHGKSSSQPPSHDYYRSDSLLSFVLLSQVTRTKEKTLVFALPVHVSELERFEGNERMGKRYSDLQGKSTNITK